MEQCADTCTIPDDTLFLTPSFQVAEPIIFSNAPFIETVPLSTVVDAKYKRSAVYNPKYLDNPRLIGTRPALDRYTATNQTRNETLTFENVVLRGDWSSVDKIEVNNDDTLVILKQQIEISELLDDAISRAITTLLYNIDWLITVRKHDTKLINSIQKFVDNWRNLEQQRKETWERLRKKLVDMHLNDLLPFGRFGMRTLVEILLAYEEYYAAEMFGQEFEEDSQSEAPQSVSAPSSINSTPLKPSSTAKVTPSSKPAPIEVPRQTQYRRKNPFTIIPTL